MIAIDTSALIAIIFDEPERQSFKIRLEAASKALVSTVSVAEAKMVAQSRRGQRAVIILEGILAQPRFEITPPGVADMNAAYDAFVAFGKGSGHRAGLNFGDVFSYALAKVRGLPLLYKGDDFVHTDIQSAASAPHQ
jgi:ribonuclease VapC